MTRFDDIQARHAKATPGPWERDPWEADAEGAVLWNIPAEDWEFVSHCPGDVGWLLNRVTQLTEALKDAWLRCEHCKGLGRVSVALQGRPESSGMANCPRCKGDGYVRAALDTEQT